MSNAGGDSGYSLPLDGLAGFGFTPPALLVPAFDILTHDVLYSGVGQDNLLAPSNVNRVALILLNETSGVLFVGPEISSGSGRRIYRMDDNSNLQIVFGDVGALVGREIWGITLGGSGRVTVTEVIYRPRCY